MLNNFLLRWIGSSNAPTGAYWSGQGGRSITKAAGRPTYVCDLRRGAHTSASNATLLVFAYTTLRGCVSLLEGGPVPTAKQLSIMFSKPRSASAVFGTRCFWPQRKSPDGFAIHSRNEHDSHAIPFPCPFRYPSGNPEPKPGAHLASEHGVTAHA